MGQTPIYDQLRGERINADVPATGADPQLVDHPGKHHLLAVAPGSAAVFGPPGPGTDLNGNRHHLLGTYPAGQPAGEEAGRSRCGDCEQAFAGSPRATNTGTRRQQLPGDPGSQPQPRGPGRSGR
jgi:hypothetical protein